MTSDLWKRFVDEQTNLDEFLDTDVFDLADAIERIRIDEFENWDSKDTIMEYTMSPMYTFFFFLSDMGIADALLSEAYGLDCGVLQ